MSLNEIKICCHYQTPLLSSTSPKEASRSRSSVIKHRATDKLSKAKAKFAWVASGGFEVFCARDTQLTCLWPTLRSSFSPGNLASKERFPLVIVNGCQRRKHANQCCGFEEVMTKVSKPNMMLFQHCGMHLWFGAEVLPELLMKPHKRCRWLFNDVEDAS